MLRQFLEIELEDTKNLLIGASVEDTPRLQGGGRALRNLLTILSAPMGDITPKVESKNG